MSAVNKLISQNWTLHVVIKPLCIYCLGKDRTAPHTCAVLCLVSQPCPTLYDPMDCSLPSSSVHVILHARILEWVAISLSKGSFQPRDQTQVSHIASNSMESQTHPFIFFFNKERKIMANPQSIKSYIHVNEIYNLSYRKK